MASVHWAVIGAGGIARRRTIPEGILAAEDAELVAVYSPSSGKEVGRQFDALAVESEDALYDMPWDALYVASPVDCHCRQVVQAAVAGRHVLCEKPLGLNSVEAEQMVTACEKASVLLGTGFMMRLHSRHQQAADIVAAGTLGHVSFARAQLSCWYPPMDGAWRQIPQRSGGGVIPDLASHCIDLLEMILGKPVIQVSCLLSNLIHDYAVEDTAAILLRFEDETLATIDCLFNTPDNASKNRLEIYGSLGSLLAEGTIGQGSGGTLSILSKERSTQYDARQFRPNDCHEEFPCPDSPNIYLAQIQAFNRAILQGDELPATGRQGLRIQRVIDACYLSSQEKRVIELS